MKKLFVASMIAATLVLSGCTSETRFGDCVGIDDEKDPTLNYDVSVKNVALGIVFSELFLIPPLVVAFDELSCPVSKKEPTVAK